MIIHTIRFLFLLLLCCNALAAELVAEVNEPTVSIQSPVRLVLKLIDAKLKSNIDLSILKQDFTIGQQQHFSNTSIINGKRTSENGWEIYLFPRAEGQYIIPSFEVETNQGRLRSEPVTINVVQNVTNNQEGQSEVIVEAKVELNDVYVRQQFIYHLKIIAKAPLNQSGFEEIKSDNAIMEMIGKPSESTQILEGNKVSVITLQYIVTPLEEGLLTIPAPVLRGQIQDRSNRHQRNRFDRLFYDPFNRLADYKPFTAIGNEIVLTVKPPQPDVIPWLPLSHLTISEDWENTDDIKVGDPITREVRLEAIGTMGSQLPNILPRLQAEGFKTYSDNPKISEDYNQNNSRLTGSRYESLSYVPQQAGEITLPEVKMAWWDVDTDAIAYAILPEKTITVNELPQSNVSPTSTDFQDKIEASYSDSKELEITVPWYFYAIIAGLLAVLIVVVMVVFVLYKKIQKLGVNSQVTATTNITANDEVVLAENLDRIAKTDFETPQQLRDYVLHYASKNWQTAQNMTLVDLFQHLKNEGFEYDQTSAEQFIEAINTALYCPSGVDLVQLRQQWERVQSQIKKPMKNGKGKLEKLPKLNPT